MPLKHEATTLTDGSPLVKDVKAMRPCEKKWTPPNHDSAPPIPNTRRPFLDEAIVQEVHNTLKGDVKFEKICPKIVFIGSQSSGKTSLFNPNPRK